MAMSSAGAPRLTREQAEAYVRGFSGARIAVLGDVMLDRYFWGDVDRISPEAPVPVVRVTRRSARPGGAANVAANLRGLGCMVDMCGIVGDDREADELRALLGDMSVATTGLVTVPGRETTEKVRIIARSQQVVRADFETEDNLEDGVHEGVLRAVAAMASTHDALVISDYGKGVIAQAMLSELIPLWRAAGRPVLVDPHVPHFSWYRESTVLTPNTREATVATGVAFDRKDPPAAEAFDTIAALALDALLVTRGERGMSLYHDRDKELHIPTNAREVYDVTGAGDTVISVLAAALACGSSMVDGVVMANAAAGEVVKEVGTTALSVASLLNAFNAQGESR